MHILTMFSLTEEAVADICRLAPDADVHEVGRKSPELDAELARAEVIVGWPEEEHLAKAPALRWLHVPSAGADWWARRLDPSIQLTNSSGVFGVPIAEHVFAMMLALTRGLVPIVLAQQTKTWRAKADRVELLGQTIGILGVGDIGTQVAIRAKAFGMHTLGLKRNTSRHPQGIDELFGPAGLGTLMARSDHVVVTLPGTTHTEGFLDRSALAAMKDGAYLYNVGRGRTIDEKAMIERLRTGKLAGAGLDVFEDEPLPDDSPLWEMPNVIVSPHCSGATPHHRVRVGQVFLANLRAYLADQPMKTLVDKQWQY